MENTKVAFNPKVVAGLDVSKKHLDFVIHGRKSFRRFENTSDGIGGLIGWLAKKEVEFIVSEATGGLEIPALLTMHEAGFLVARVNPRWIKNFGKAQGQYAKTDALDARIIAAYGVTMKPKPWTPYDTDMQSFKDLAGRGRPDIAAPLGLPKNANTGRNYSGVNILLLWSEAIEAQRTTQTWLTYKQAQAMGAQVRKGETGTTICYADTFIPKAEKQRALESGNTPIPIGFLKRYTVFNADQCEGLDPSFFEGVEPLPERELIPRAEKLISATGADFRTGGERFFG